MLEEILNAEARPSQRRCMARYVPERADDIFWENDRIGYRIYGPALATDARGPLTSSGIDVWVKSVRSLFMDRALAGGNYHEDQGEGMDCYDTGRSRGCGGLGVWDDRRKTLFTSGNWSDKGIIRNGPEVASFWASYDPWMIGDGRRVAETRAFSLAEGSNLTRMVSTLKVDGPGDLLVGIGLAKRNVDQVRFIGQEHLSIHPKEGIMAYWEPEQAGKGTTGCAVMVDPSSIASFVTDDPLQNIVVVNVRSGQPFVYYAGACWTGGLDFHSREQWEKYVQDFKPAFGTSP